MNNIGNNKLFMHKSQTHNHVISWQGMYNYLTIKIWPRFGEKIKNSKSPYSKTEIPASEVFKHMFVKYHETYKTKCYKEHFSTKTTCEAWMENSRFNSSTTKDYVNLLELYAQYIYNCRRVQ